MSKSFYAVFVGAVFMTGMLCGCDKAPQADSKTPSSSAIAAPDAPAAPAVPAPDAKAAEQASAPSASAGADVSVQGTEARAGDVSVKLPD